MGTFTLDLSDTNTTDPVDMLSGQTLLVGFDTWGAGGVVTPVFISKDGGKVLEFASDTYNDASNSNSCFTAPCDGSFYLKVTTTGSGNATGEKTLGANR